MIFYKPTSCYHLCNPNEHKSHKAIEGLNGSLKKKGCSNYIEDPFSNNTYPPHIGCIQLSGSLITEQIN